MHVEEGLNSYVHAKIVNVNLFFFCNKYKINGTNTPYVVVCMQWAVRVCECVKFPCLSCECRCTNVSAVFFSNLLLKLFQRCLMVVLNIDLWKCYITYVRQTKSSLRTFRWVRTIASSKSHEVVL